MIVIWIKYNMIVIFNCYQYFYWKLENVLFWNFKNVDKPESDISVFVPMSFVLAKSSI